MKESARKRGILVVVSGPSGVGKTTVVRRILMRPGFRRAVTATTRPPRPGERDGVDYHFLSPEEFEAGIASGRFLEYAIVYGNRYGTPRAEVEEILAAGDRCLLNVDVQGAAQIRGRIQPALFVFLVPPSLAVLGRRLAGRGTEDAGTVKRRLAVARTELARENEYDVSVTNDDLKRAVEKVVALVVEREKEA